MTKSFKGIFFCLILLMGTFLLVSCGGDGGSGGPIIIPTSIPTSIPTAIPISTPSSPGTVTVPNGFISVPANISSGTLNISVDNFNSGNEGYLMLVYHSTSPNDTANPLSIQLEIADRLNREKSSTAVNYNKKDGNLLKTSQKPYERFYKNHLIKLQKDFDLVKKLTLEGKKPRQLTVDELKARGRKVDNSGMVSSVSVGDERDFWIWFPFPYSPNLDGGMISRPCQCYAVGKHCYVFLDTDDPPIYYTNATSYSQQLASYFDNQVYPLVHQYIGTEWNPGIDGDPRMYIILSANFDNAYYPFADAYPQSNLPFDEYSNEVEAVYADPIIFCERDDWGNVVETAESALNFTQAIIGHEFTHMVRFNMKHIASNQNIPQDWNVMSSYFSVESAIHEGCSQFTENVLLHRGITDNYGDLASLRSAGLEAYLQQPELCTLTSSYFNNDYNDGLGIYETGFFVTQYLYEKMGYDALTRLNQADGKLGLDSLYAAAGNRNAFENIFDKHGLTLILSGRVSDSNYTFSGVDLSGGINYGGTRLHNAWSAYSNVQIDYARGIDVSQLIQDSGYTDLYEWSPWFLRFYNGDGGRLEIRVTGLTPGSGGGDVKAYFFYR